MSESVYIVAGARTPIGSFLGALSSLTAPELGALAIKAAINLCNIHSQFVQEVYMGCVLTSGIGQAPARQAMIKAGLPESTGATTIGKVCGSGMKALMLARNEILAGEADLLVAGGMESMSQVPFLLKGGRQGFKMGHQTMWDAMIYDGLWDPYDDVHMGNCAERCAEKYGFTRAAQDQFSAMSFERSLAALDSGAFKEEITPVSVAQRKGEPIVVAEDESPRKGNPAKLPDLKPAFEKTGTITAGNASSINDGAAALVLASEKAVQEHHLEPMAKILAIATHSQEPVMFTTAPVGAIQKVLLKANLRVEQIDLFEINEAFAVVPMAAIQELKLDPDKVNVRGGAVSLGHPIGASGARLVVTLIHALSQLNKRYGLATLCIGGGEATAMIVENMAYKE